MISYRIMNFKSFLLVTILVSQIWIDNARGQLSDSRIIFASDDSENQSCQSDSGIEEKCINIKHCTSIINNNRKSPKICSWEGNIPLICCPVTPSIKYSKLVANPECGRSPKDPPIMIAKRSFRYIQLGDVIKVVVGGKDAKPFAWPWMVSIHRKTLTGERYLCGGSIISDRFILTAAHCFGENPKTASEYLVKTQGLKKELGINEEVQDIKVHPGYRDGQHYNDIAIITLTQPIVFNDRVSPACLPSVKSDYLDREVTVLGWGDTSYAGRTSELLQEATFNVIPNADCNASYSKLQPSSLPKGVTEDFLCAGVNEGGKDACQGDSGGPLMLKEYPSLRWSVIGVVSFGYQCAKARFPGIYTRVYNYIQWISDNTNLNI